MTSRQEYHFAPLTGTQLKSLMDAERQINMEAGKEIIILAFEKDKE